MKKMTKVLALLMVCVMCIGLCACGKTPSSVGPQTSTGSNQSSSSSSGDSSSAKQDSGSTQAAGDSYNYDITVWVPELAVELTQKQIAAFNETNTDGITLNATIEAVSEADAASTMITDVESGADIFFFAQDQAARLIQAGALSKLGTGAQGIVSEANDAGVVAAATSGEEMYAYPLTSDNGYFMYYDNTVIPEADLDDLTALIADCEAAGRTFCMELQTSAWYIASFFFATGCDSTWTLDDAGKEFISVNDTFNSANGLISAKGIRELITSPAHVSTADGTQFDASVPAAIVVSGTWDYNNVLNILGDKMGTADLPSFTVDGKSYHLGSYNGCKLLGVKPQTDVAKAACVHKLAQYLTSESAQLERFEALAWGPANTNAQASDEVQANPGLAALFQQAPYSKPQGQIHGSWWDIAKVIGTDILESDGTDAGLQYALDHYSETISALFNMTSDEKEAFSVIGSIGGDGWSIDIPMTRTSQPGDATYYTEALNLKAGEEFKVRKGGSWDVNFGADGAINGPNCVVENDGVYFIKLVVNADQTQGIISLEKSSFYSWTVIGSIAGDGWSIDIPMLIQDDGTTFKTEPIELTAGEEFKVRKDANWDENFGANGVAGGDNIVVETSGTYTIVFDSLTGMITLE